MFSTPSPHTNTFSLPFPLSYPYFSLTCSIIRLPISCLTSFLIWKLSMFSKRLFHGAKTFHFFCSPLSLSLSLYIHTHTHTLTGIYTCLYTIKQIPREWKTNFFFFLNLLSWKKVFVSVSCLFKLLAFPFRHSDSRLDKTFIFYTIWEVSIGNFGWSIWFFSI